MIAYIEAHGRSRFDAAWEDGVERVINCVGFRRRGDDDRWEYMILPGQWRAEVAKGFDTPRLVRAMIERRQVIAAKDGKPSTPVKVPRHGTTRLYVLAPGIIGDVEANDAG